MEDIGWEKIGGSSSKLTDMGQGLEEFDSAAEKELSKQFDEMGVSATPTTSGCSLPLQGCVPSGVVSKGYWNCGAFEIGAAGMTPPVLMYSSVPAHCKGSWTGVLPSLRIVLERSVFLAEYQVRFSLQVMNLPSGCRLSVDLVDLEVVSPVGEVVPHKLWEVEKRSLLFQPNCSFFGYFVSSSQAGFYFLRARLPLPPIPSFVEAGLFGTVLEDIVVAKVCRNYFRSSFSGLKDCFQLNNYSSWELGPVPLLATIRKGSLFGDPHVWGLAHNKYTNLLYYTDWWHGTMFCVTPEGQIVFRRRECGSRSCLPLLRPFGLSHDGWHNRLVVADKGNHRICFVDMDGRYISSFGLEGNARGRLFHPSDVAVSPDGSRIVVADTGNSRLQLFDWSGQFLEQFSVFGPRSPTGVHRVLQQPRGLAFNNDGTKIYVSDMKKGLVLELSLDLKSSRSLLLPGQSLFRPQGLAVDRLDTLLITESGYNRVLHVQPWDGHVLSRVYRCGSHLLQCPVNATVMGDDSLVLVDGRAGLHVIP